MAGVPIGGFRRVQVRVGDSLQWIAARELGDAAQWVTIAGMNNLVPPYLDAVRSPGVIAYGDTIIIPGTDVQLHSGTSAEDTLLTDVALTNGLLGASGRGDLSFVSGHANLRQALSHRLVVDEDELLFHGDEYGCEVGQYRGEKNGPLFELKSITAVTRSLRMDPRVDRVLSVTAVSSGDRINVEASVMAIGGHPLDISQEV